MGLFDLFNIFDHRADTLLDGARAQGLSASDGDPFGCTRAPFALLQRGDERKVKTVLWRQDDPHRIRAFDYRYFDRDSEGHLHPSPLFTCATAVVNASWPFLSITPRSANLGFTTLFDEHHDYDVLDPAFSDAFSVRTSDDRFASALLATPMRYLLLDHARALDIEFHGSWLFLSAEQIPVDLVPNLFGFIDDLVGHVPDLIGEFYPPPLQGGLDTPMPDPYQLARLSAAEAGDLLSSYAYRDASAYVQLADSLSGRNHGLTDIESSAPLSIFEQEWWIKPRSIADAAAEPVGPQQGFDLDGNPVDTHARDPWGEGRSRVDDPTRAEFGDPHNTA